MLGLSLALVFVCFLAGLSRAHEGQGIAQSVLEDLVFYFKYASSTYANACPRPNGNILVNQFDERSTDTQGYVARDDNRKEIVVALRGTTSLVDVIRDARFTQSPYHSPGVSAPNGTRVHTGFLEAYNSVADTIISTVRGELQSHPDYSLVITGHSLGGSLASLAAVSLKGNFPLVDARLYTYGQPRTGNPTFASWVNDQFGAKAFRGVHTYDGVPTFFPQSIGYRHHGVEYWSNRDPSRTENVKKCAADGEDATCSSSIPSTALNPPHLWYYDIFYQKPFCN